MTNIFCLITKLFVSLFLMPTILILPENKGIVNIFARAFVRAFARAFKTITKKTERIYMTTKNITKKLTIINRTDLGLRIPKTLLEITKMNKDTEMEFSIDKKGLLIIKQVAK